MRVRAHCGPVVGRAVRAKREVWVEYCRKRRRKGCGFDMFPGCAIARWTGGGGGDAHDI